MPSWPDLHPFIVHFPVALLTVAPIVLVWGISRRDRGVSRAGLALVAIGTVGLWLSIASGDAGRGRVPADPVVQAELEEHASHGNVARIAFVAVLAVLSWLEFGRARSGRWTTVARVVLIVSYVIGLGNVLAAAHHGGRLVHEHGVHVDLSE